MGESKENTVYVSTKIKRVRRTPGIIRKIPRKGKLVIAVVVLLVVGGIAFWQLRPTQKPAPKETLEQTFKDSSRLINDGQYSAAEQQLTEFIDSSAPIADKQDATMALADVYIAKKDYDKALQVLLELEKAKPGLSYTAFTTMYGLYEKKGEREKAIEYLKKAIESIKRSPEPTDDIYLAQYEHKLKALEQRQ